MIRSNKKMTANSNPLSKFHLVSIKLMEQESKTALEISQKRKH